MILVPFLVDAERDEICCWLSFSLVRKNHVSDVKIVSGWVFSPFKIPGQF